MNNTFTITAVGSVLLLAIAGVSFANSMTSAPKEHRMNSETRQAIEKAIESQNYEEFKVLTEGHKRAKFITEENFSLLDDLHAAKESKNFEEVKRLKEEMGIPEDAGRKGRNHEKHEKREAIAQAAENNDFSTFQELAKDTPLADTINEENFSIFQEFIQAKKNNDIETVKTLKAELGLPDHQKGKGKCNRKHNDQ